MFEVGEIVTNKNTNENYIVKDKFFQLESCLFFINDRYCMYNSELYNSYISQIELRKLKIDKLKEKINGTIK